MIFIFLFFILTLSPPTVRMLKAFQAQCPMSNICSKCTLTHTHSHVYSFTHSFRSGSSGFKRELQVYLGAPQVTNTGTEELIHCGERGQE